MFKGSSPPAGHYERVDRRNLDAGIADTAACRPNQKEPEGLAGVLLETLRDGMNEWMNVYEGSC